MSLIEHTQSPFRSYRAPRVAVVPIERVRRPAPPPPLPVIEIPPPMVEIKPASPAEDQIYLECVVLLRLAERDYLSGVKYFSARAIVCHVAKYYDVTVADIERQSRCRGISTPRHVAYYLVRRLTKLSYPQIGRFFGDRDHTTILSGVKRIAHNKPNDYILAAQIEKIIAKMRADGYRRNASEMEAICAEFEAEMALADQIKQA